MMLKIYNFIKEKLIYFLIGGVALASTIVLIPEEISTELQLKVPKSEIVYSHEYTEYEYNESEIVSQKRIVSYSYKSGEVAPVLKDEVIEKRTQNIVTRNLGGNKRSAQSGYNFYKEEGKWKKIKFHKTTKDAYEKQTISFLDRFKVFAADTGATSPGTMANDSSTGTTEWTTVDNAKASDDSYAHVAFPSDGNTQLLKATNFGFSIPSGATIDGIVVEIEEKSPSKWTVDEILVKLVVGGSIVGDNKTFGYNDFPAVEAYFSHGGSTDKWGLTPTYSEINASDFGMVLQAYAGSTSTADVDHIRITVYYTAGAPTATTNQQNIIWFE